MPVICARFDGEFFRARSDQSFAIAGSASRENIVDLRGIMRISGLVVLCFCLLSVATGGEAAASAFGGCSCTEQVVAARPGYWGYHAQQPRAGEVYRARRLHPARQMYGAQGRAVVARRAPYQGAQVPRYTYGGSQIIQRPAVQYWTYRAQQARARQVYRTQRRPSVAHRAQRQPVEASRSQAEPAVTRNASQQEVKAPHYAFGGGEIIQHPAGCPVRLFCGCGASIEVFGHSIRDLWLVSNWYRFPRAAPAAGMAVLWGTRHVAVIRQYFGDGTAMLYDREQRQRAHAAPPHPHSWSCSRRSASGTRVAVADAELTDADPLGL